MYVGDGAETQRIDTRDLTQSPVSWRMEEKEEKANKNAGKI
jgi:hypothetical protein